MTNEQAADAEESGGAERVITLTDGVVAIAMTLLALDLRPDDVARSASAGELGRYFRENSGQYSAFVIAFLIVAQYWVVHHRLMQGVRRQDSTLLRANMLFLFGVTLIPLTSYLNGNFESPLVTTIFAASLILMSVSLALMSETVQRHGLRNRPADPGEHFRGRARLVTTIAIPVLVAVLDWFVPHASYLFFLYLLSDTPGRILWQRRVEAARA